MVAAASSAVPHAPQSSKGCTFKAEDGCERCGTQRKVHRFQSHLPRAQELCESRGGRPGFPVPNSPYSLCGRKATLKNRAQELCESRGGRPGFPFPYCPHGTVSVDVKQHIQLELHLPCF